MQHPDEGTIHAWLDGALTADEAAQIEAHVKSCPECAAAVAEARGFIAASSRILTALDNAPRGVIPTTAPVKRRFDPMAWRIAASVLVIAGGTFLVVRNQGTREASAPARSLTLDTSSSVAAFNAVVESTQTAATASVPPAALSSPAGAPGRRGAAKSSGAATGSAAPSVSTVNQPDLSTQAVTAMESRAPTAQKTAMPTAGARDDNVIAAAAPAATMRFVPSANGAAGAVAAEDRAVGPTEPLKVIGSPRRLGAKVTVYEIAGDTVTLTESMQLQLQSVVVTGVATARVQGEKAAAARTNSAEPAPQTPTVAGGSASLPAPPAAPTSAPVPAPVHDALHPDDPNAVHTITWVDPVTRNTMALSGRMSEARLQLIRARIESERAAAKKTP